jgi:putative ABC transport system substrate-binding protein
MNRKKVVGLVLSAMLLALGFPAEAEQAKKISTIGVLAAPSASFISPRVNAFREGLHDLGYVEGKNIAIEYRYAEGKLDQLPALAAELVRLKVDVIVAVGTPAIKALKTATRTIPIVMATVGDPIGTGIVESLARPGGNITGLTILSPELSGKRLELLKETFPRVTRVAVLWNPSNQSNSIALKETQAASQALALQLQSLEVRSLKDFEDAFESATRIGAHAIITLPDALINTHHRRISDFAAKNRLPAMYAGPEFVEAGGLMSYAPSYTDQFRRAAYYVDKILKGAKPAELPVEQPTKFELVINLKAAKQIGLTIPPNVLARADRVIK